MVFNNIILLCEHLNDTTQQHSISSTFTYDRTKHVDTKHYVICIYI